MFDVFTPALCYSFLVNQYLRYAIYAGLFAVLFIPLVVTEQLFFPFITGKGFAFRTIVEIIFALWFILALRDANVRPHGSALLYALALFVISLGISTFLSENPVKSFWSNFERMEGWIGLAHLFLYFVVATTMLRTEKIWKAFWNISIGVSVILGAYGLFQLAGILQIHQGGVRVDATFGNSTYLAVYMLIHAFITLIALVSWTKEKWLRAFYALALILQAAMVFYSATRGAILGLIGGLMISALIVVLFGKEHRQLRKWVGGAALILIVLIGGFFAVKDTPFVRADPVLSRLASISLSEGATRFTIWNMALRGGLERPVFGWGPESFNYIFNKDYKASLYGQEPWFDRAHNQFLDWLVAGGVPGFLLYLSLYAYALLYLWRKPKTPSPDTAKPAFSFIEQAFLTGLLAAYAFHNLFVFDNLMSSVLFVTVIGYILVKSGRGKAGILGVKTLSGFVWQGAVAVSLIVFASVFYFANVPSIVRAYTIVEALKPHGEALTRNFEYYQQAVSGSGIGIQEANEQLLQFAFRIRGQDVAARSTPEFKQEVAIFAAQSFSQQIERAPNDTRLQIFFASFLHQLGDLTGAKDAAEKAHALSPQKQSVFFELGTIAQDAGNLQEALDWFKQAYELEPAYDTARSYYAATAIRLGEKDLARSLLIDRFKTESPDDDFVLQAYLDVRDFEKVLAIAEGRVEKSPDNVEKRIQLAAAYLQAGRRSDAISSLREAIRLRPDFKAQGDYFIGEIEAGRNP